MKKPGYVDGRHYTAWVEAVRQLRRDGDDATALRLLERLMAAALDETSATGLPPPSWYFEQTAIIHRRLKNGPDEIAVLQRFVDGVPHGFEVPPNMVERLRKAEARSKG